MASRPFDTLRVMAVPAKNVAVLLLPTGTLMPAGLDVICSPLRPLALTASVILCACGTTVSEALRAIPAAFAVMVATVESVTVPVVTVKVALVAPWATTTLAGTVANAVLLANATLKPPDGAAAVSNKVPCAVAPPCTLVGLIDSADKDAVAAGGEMVSVALRLAPP